MLWKFYQFNILLQVFFGNYIGLLQWLNLAIFPFFSLHFFGDWKPSKSLHFQFFNFSFWLNFANKKSEQVFSLDLICKVLDILTRDLQNLYHPNLDNFERPYVICEVLESLAGTLQICKVLTTKYPGRDLMKSVSQSMIARAEGSYKNLSRPG